MDLEQIKYLPDPQKDRYAKLERVFQSDGWAYIVEHAKQNYESARERALNAGSWDEVVAYRARSQVYAEFALLAETTEAEFAQIAENNKATIEQRDEVDFE